MTSSGPVDISLLAADLRERIVAARRDKISVRLGELMNEFQQPELNQASIATINSALTTAGLQCRPELTVRLRQGDRILLTPVQPRSEAAHVAHGGDGSAVEVAQPLSQIKISTTFEIPGMETVAFHGDVFGQVVRSRNVFSNLGASAKSLVGGELGGLSKLLADSRHEALSRIREEARLVGANAVVGLRYDSSALGDHGNEIVAYGTAVTVRAKHDSPAADD